MRALLGVVHVAGFATLFAPMVLGGEPGGGRGAAHAVDAPILLALMVPALLAIAVGEAASKRLDAKGIALLGVLCALNAALRIPGSLGGASLMFVLPVLGGAVFGSTFGFLLGALSFAVSAVVTGGIGPWLPFQMLALGWIGAGAGAFRRERDLTWVGVAALCAYGYVAGFFFGIVTDLWFWPFVAAGDAAISWRPGLGLVDGARAFWRFYVATSLAWDAGRAVANAALLAALARPVMRMLRRTRDRMWTQPASEPIAASTASFAGKSLDSLPG